MRYECGSGLTCTVLLSTSVEDQLVSWLILIVRGFQHPTRWTIDDEVSKKSFPAKEGAVIVLFWIDVKKFGNEGICGSWEQLLDIGDEFLSCGERLIGEIEPFVLISSS